MKIWSQRHNDCAQVLCEQAAALPDYYPPILRVVKLTGRPWVKEVREQAGVVQVSGEMALNLLYQTEDEKGLCAYQTTAAFSHSFSLPEGCQGRADAWPGRVELSCRLASARRVSFKASVPVYLTVEGEQELAGPPRQEGIHYLTRPVQGRCVTGYAARRFHLSESADCDATPAALLDTNVTAVVTDLSGAGGKTLVRGEMTVHTLYVTKTDELGVLCRTFPLSQLIDLPYSEAGDVAVQLRVGAVETEMGERHDGGRAQIGYEIDLAVSACASENRTGELVCDAFCETNAMDLTRETAAPTVALGRVRGSLEVHLSLPEDPEGGLVTDACAVLSGVQAKTVEGKLTAEGECTLSLLVCEDSGRIRQREIVLPLRAVLPHPPRGRAQIQVWVWSALPMGEGVRLNLRYELAQWQDGDCEYLSAAAPDPGRPLPELTRHPITVYFADAGEAVWDVAKRYRVSPERIRRDNALDGDTVKEKCRLLIR